MHGQRRGRLPDLQCWVTKDAQPALPVAPTADGIAEGAPANRPALTGLRSTSEPHKTPSLVREHPCVTLGRCSDREHQATEGALPVRPVAPAPDNTAAGNSASSTAPVEPHKDRSLVCDGGSDSEHRVPDTTGIGQLANTWEPMEPDGSEQQHKVPSLVCGQHRGHPPNSGWRVTNDVQLGLPVTPVPAELRGCSEPHENHSLVCEQPGDRYLGRGSALERRATESAQPGLPIVSAMDNAADSRPAISSAPAVPCGSADLHTMLDLVRGSHCRPDGES
jgi:hypothetical protein